MDFPTSKTGNRRFRSCHSDPLELLVTSRQRNVVRGLAPSITCLGSTGRSKGLFEVSLFWLFETGMSGFHLPCGGFGFVIWMGVSKAIQTCVWAVRIWSRHLQGVVSLPMETPLVWVHQYNISTKLARVRSPRKQQQVNHG